MSWKTIETSREIRQWIRLLIPVGVATLFLISEHPEWNIFKKGEKKNEEC